MYRLVVGLAAAATFAQAEPVDFAEQIQPLFETRCYACHGEANAINGLRLDRKEDALRGGHSGPAILPGDSTRAA